MTDLHARWGTERSGIVEAHHAALQSEASQARAEAVQTIAEANAQAKSKTDEAEKAEATNGQAESGGWWHKIKAAGGRVVGAVKDLAASALSFAASVLAAARQKVVGLLRQLGAAVRERLGRAFEAIRNGVRRTWMAIGAAVKRAQEVVSKLAATAIVFARRVWDAAKATIDQGWRVLKSAGAAALDAAKAVVAKVAAAVATIKEIVKLLASQALGRLFEAVKDPEGKIVPVIAAKAAPLVGQVPAKADELAEQKSAEVAPPVESEASVQRLVVQRAPSTAPAPAVAGPERDAAPAAPAGEGFWGGVWRHMKATGRGFVEHYQEVLAKVVLSLLLFFPVLMEEGPKLWDEAKAVFNPGGGMDTLDHVLGVLRRLVNIVAGLVATTGIWALIIGAFSGPGEAFVVGAFETISIGVIAADVTLGLAEMGKSWYSATRPGIEPTARESYLEMFSSSAIATAICLILVLLGAIASRLGRAFKAIRNERGAAEGATKVKPKGEPIETKPGEATSGEAKPGEAKPGEEKTGHESDEPEPERLKEDDVGPGTGMANEEDIHPEDFEPTRKPGEPDVDLAICFAVGTPVSTPAGPRPIETLECGDLVHSFDDVARRVVIRRVIGTTRGRTTRWIEIDVGGDVIRSTSAHRFWIESKSLWLAAEDILPGMTMRSQDRTSVQVDRVTPHALDAPETTYNLSIDAVENYFVGGLQVLVHNITQSRITYMSRPGYRNYVLRDVNDVIYYSGMFGPGVSEAEVRARHAKNNGRFDSAKGDKFELQPGSRQYGEARLMENELAVASGTVKVRGGADPKNYRCNRQRPLSESVSPEYREFRQYKEGCG